MLCHWFTARVHPQMHAHPLAVQSTIGRKQKHQNEGIDLYLGAVDAGEFHSLHVMEK